MSDEKILNSCYQKSKISSPRIHLSNYNKSNDVSIDYKEYKINFLII